MHTLYTWLYRLALPLVLIHLWWRGRADSAYRERWRERFGRVPKRDSQLPLIWIHAASVGEALIAGPLIRQLSERHDNWQWLVTSITPTGSRQVQQTLEPLLGGHLLHYYLPFDLPGRLSPFLDALRPDMLICIETELWPNLLSACTRRGIPSVLANARLSEKSARGYARFPRFTHSMLDNLTQVVAQYPADAERFVKLGLPAERVKVTGNIKFDLQIDADQSSEAQELSRQWRGAQGRPVWLAASTHEGEDAIVLDAFGALRREFPQLLLVLVPRHPQRIDAVTQQCRERNLKLLRRSEGRAPGPEEQVLLGDTMGELLRFYGTCDMAFVGGSLVPVGGHNMIEPAAWGVPVVCGPHLHNFAAVSALLLEADAMKVAGDGDELAQHLTLWLRDEDGRCAAGERGRQVAQQNSGALISLVGEVDGLAEKLV